MKKIYILLAACLIAGAALAQVTIKKFPAGNSPVMDGIQDAVWFNIDSIAIKNLDATHPATFLDAGIFPYFKMGWTDTSIVIFLQVDDDQLCNQWCTGLLNYQSDRPEIYFDVNTWPGGTQPGCKIGIDKGVYQYVGDQAFGTDTLATYQGYNADWYTEAEHVDGNSYTFEFNIPFVSFHDSLFDTLSIQKPIVEGYKIGFDLYVLDRDPDDPTPWTDNNRKWDYSLSTAGGAWDDMGKCGTLTFSTQSIFSGLGNISFENNITVTPNPATNLINISKEATSVKIYDALGRLQLEKGVLNKRVDITNLKSGFYFVNVYSGKRLAGQTKFIKQ